MPESENTAEFQEQQMIPEVKFTLFEETDSEEEDIHRTNLASSEPPTLEKPTDTEATTVTGMTQVAPAQKQFKQTVSVSSEKWKLIEARLPIPNVDDSYAIRVDSAAGQITIQGEETAVMAATGKVYEILSSVSEHVLRDVSPEVASLLLTPGGQEILAKSSFSGVLNVRDDGVYLTAYSTSAAETAKTLKGLIQSRKTAVYKHHYPFLQSRQCKALIDKLQSKFIVHIKLNLEDQNILISGIEVDAAMEELQAKLKEKAVTTDFLLVTSGIGRFIETYERELKDRLQSR